MLGEQSAAIESYQKSFKLRPTVHTSVAIGMAYSKVGDYRNAILHFLEYVKSYSFNHVQRHPSRP